MTEFKLHNFYTKLTNTCKATFEHLGLIKKNATVQAEICRRGINSVAAKASFK